MTYISGSTSIVGTLTPIANGFISLSRRDDQNTGYYTQGQAGFGEMLFLTAGLRGEQNPAFGSKIGTNYAPRVGASLVHDVGPATVKLRAAYGKATRPPRTGLQEGQIVNTVVTYIPSPLLSPEYQNGTDAGIDIYVGTGFGLQTTFYNQSVRDAIFIVELPELKGTGTINYRQAQNIGDLRNQGTEVEAQANVGAVRLTGTYSKIGSRILAVGPRYTGTQKPGDELANVPKRTGALSASYSVRRVTLNGDMTYVGPINYTENTYQARASAARLMPYTAATSIQYSSYPGVYRFNATTNYTFNSRASAYVRVRNISNASNRDVAADFPSIGRQSVVGLRLRF
jgi:hypothetical protein